VAQAAQLLAPQHLEDYKAKQVFLVQSPQQAVAEVHRLEAVQYLAQAVQAAVAHLQPTQLPMVQVDKATLAVLDLLEKTAAAVEERMPLVVQLQVQVQHLQQALAAQD
jgi:hypothetical protein